jgi:hypothetical protein
LIYPRDVLNEDEIDLMLRRSGVELMCDGAATASLPAAQERANRVAACRDMDAEAPMSS